MNLVVIPELRALVEETRTIEATARRHAERIERLLHSLEQEAIAEAGPGSDPLNFKRPDGRLTEAGIAAIEAAFEAQATVSQVAKDFEIQVSAASNRKKIWEAKVAKKAEEERKAAATA